MDTDWLGHMLRQEFEKHAANGHVAVLGEQDVLIANIVHAIELRKGIEANARLAELSTEIHNSISRIRCFYTAVRRPGDLTGQ